MKRLRRTAVASLAVSLATMSYASLSRAQEVVTHEVTEEKTETVPNTTLIVTGAVAFGVPYVISASIASESSHQGDSHLWVPIVGPWLDLGDRGALPPDNTSPRDTELTNRVLLVVDGVFQAAGALEVVSGFLFPVERERRVASKPWVRVSPMKLGYGGYGLGTVGSF
jgi:hypothetical protein